MGSLCEHAFDAPDPKKFGYSNTEYDLHARLGLTIRKNISLGRFEIAQIRGGIVVFQSPFFEDVVQKANAFEGGDNTQIVCGILCPRRRK